MQEKELNNQQIFKDFIVEFQKQIELKKASGIDIDTCGGIPWTEMVQEAFWEIGKIRKGIKVYMSSHGGEYLLDVMWDSVEEKKYGPILGLESEWGNNDDIMDDFYKLMYVKCNFKVLIFNSTSESNNLEIKQMIRHGLINFNLHTNGEQYLFIDISYFEPWLLSAFGFTVTQSVLENREKVVFENIGSAKWSRVSKNYIL